MQQEINFTASPLHHRHFNGVDYVPVHDQGRLAKQIDRIYDLMKDGRWMTLSEIKGSLENKYNTHFPESSISAQIRNLSKIQFGGIKHEKRTRGDRNTGLYEYRLI